jgi:hypothetical protein
LVPIDRGKNLVAAERVAEFRADAPTEIGPAPIDLEELRPLNDPALVERHVDRVADRGLLQVFGELIGRDIVDAVLVANQRMAEAEHAVGEFERDAPILISLERLAGARARAAGLASIEENRCGRAIGLIDRWMQEPFHEVMTQDASIEQRGRAARAQEAPMRRLEG